MQLERKITAGNIVSWAMILVAIVAGYVKLETTVTQNAKDVAAATALALRVEQMLRDMDSTRVQQINTISIETAVTKVRVEQMDKKIDELLVRTK